MPSSSSGGLEAGGERSPVRVRVADHEAAVDRRGDVVGVPLQLGRAHQHLLAGERQLEEVVGGEEPGDDRRGAGAEAARERDLAAQPEGDAVGGVQALEGPHDEVVAPGRNLEPAGVERELAGLLHLQLQVQRHRRRHRVVAGAEVGRGGGDADESVASGQSKTARSTALRSLSQLITAGALPSAVSGSLRPWPVRTQTTDSGGGGVLDDRQAVGEQAGDRSGRGRLAEDAFGGGKPVVGVEDLLVGDGGDAAARGGEGRHRLLPAGRVADPDRGGDGLGVGDGGAADQRRRALGLEAVEDRRRADLLEAAPVGGDVAGVADRDRQRAGGAAQLLDDLEGRRLLAFDPVRVDRVDEFDRVLVG